MMHQSMTHTWLLSSYKDYDIYKDIYKINLHKNYNTSASKMNV